MNISIHDLLPLMSDDTFIGIRCGDCTTFYQAKDLRDTEKNEYT